MELKIEYMALDKLKPYEKNARKHKEVDLSTIKASISEFGMSDPIGVWGNDNIIVEGHGRYLACKELGIEEVPVIHLDHLTDEQRRAYALAHNKTAEMSEWDFDLLGDELADILDIDMSDFGFDLSDDEEEETEVIEDEVPQEVEPVAKQGDIWQLGRHRLMCGDSTSVTDVEKLMDGNKADMVFTDPPYGNGESGKYGRGQLGVRTILNDENLDCFNDFISIMPCDKIIYFLQWRTLAESLQKVTEKGLKINTVGVWDKKNAGLNGAGGISEQWEAIVFAGDIKYKKFGGNVFNVAREQHKRSESLHPHMKPQELLKQIFDFVDGAENVLDVFGGSGSTLIACEQLDRNCFMMELDPHYVDVIIARWEQFTGQKAVLLNGNS